MMKGAYADVTQAISNTPIVRLNRLTAGLKADIYVKLTYMNPRRPRMIALAPICSAWCTTRPSKTWTETSSMSPVTLSSSSRRSSTEKVAFFDTLRAIASTVSSKIARLRRIRSR